MIFGKRTLRSRTLCLVLSLVLMVFLGQVTAFAAADPNLGLYRMESMMGLSAETIAAVAEDGSTVEDIKNMFTVELQEGGKCVFVSDGEKVDVFWKMNGTELTLSDSPNPGAGDEVLKGTVENGYMTLVAEGIELKLKKEGGSAAAEAAAAAQAALKNKAEVPDDISGVYRLNKIIGMDMGTYATLVGITPEQAANTMVMDMKADGTAYLAADGEVAMITWVRDGDKVALISWENGVEDRLDATLSGDTIIMNIDGSEIVMKRDPVM